MLWGHHPYALSGACQMSEPQKQSVGEDAVEYNTALQTNQESLSVKRKGLAAFVKYGYGFYSSFKCCNEARYNLMICCEKQTGLPYAQKWLLQTLQSGSTKERNQIAVSNIWEQKNVEKFMGEREVSHKGSTPPYTGHSRCHQRHTQSSSSLFPECFKETQSPGRWKSSLAAIKQPLSDIFSFLTNTHPPAGLGDTWRPERVVKTYHYKTSIFQKYNLCSIQCFPWKTALLRAIKRGGQNWWG